MVNTSIVCNDAHTSTDVESVTNTSKAGITPVITIQQAQNLTAVGTNTIAESQTKQQSSIPPLNVVSSFWLADTILPPVNHVVADLIGHGLSILVGAPKTGKSFLAYQLASHVANGTPFLGRRTLHGDVLYLALEDTLSRLQKRQDSMGLIPSESLGLATQCLSLDRGLCQQVRQHIQKEKPNTKLVIIDTLQMIRPTSRPKNTTAYENDVFDMKQLKALCSELDISIITVHHTVKDGSKEGLEKVSGSNGLAGTADTVLLLQRPRDENHRATIEVSGKDIPKDTIELSWDTATLTFSEVKGTDCLHQKSDSTPRPLPKELEALAHVAMDYDGFCGTNAEFQRWMEALTGLCIDVSKLKRQIRKHHDELQRMGITVTTPNPTNKGRCTMVTYNPASDAVEKGKEAATIV